MALVYYKDSSISCDLATPYGVVYLGQQWIW